MITPGPATGRLPQSAEFLVHHHCRDRGARGWRRGDDRDLGRALRRVLFPRPELVVWVAGVKGPDLLGDLDGAFTAHRETDFGCQRRRAPIRFRTVFVSRRDRERAITPVPNRGKSRVFRGDGELGVSAGLRGGAGRTRTGNQTVISPTGQSSESGADKHGIEDGRRKDWHSAANRAVVSSSWGN